MGQNYGLATGDPVLEPFFDAIQELLSGAAPYFRLDLSSATAVRANASADADEQMSLSVDGKYRFRTTAVSAAHPGGAVGTYDVYVTASANDYTGPVEDPDDTNYDFGLVIRARSSGNPSPPPGVDHSRRVGEVDWDGAAISALRQLVGHRRDDAPTSPTALLASVTPHRVRGLAGQTAPLTRWEVDGAEVAYVSAAGSFVGGALIGRAGAASAALGAKQVADTHNRLQARGDGVLEWGTGAADPDVSLERTDVGELTLDGDLLVTGDLLVGGLGPILATDAAGGDLTGTYPNPTVAAGAITETKVAAANKDGTTATLSMRTLGYGAQQAMPGNARLDQVAAPTAPVALNAQRITGLADPTADSDAATRGWAKARANHTGTQLAATVSDFDAQVRLSRLDQMATPTASVAMGGQRITGLGTPSAATDAAHKQYVDDQVSFAVFRTVHTFSVAGVIAVPSGDANVIPGFFIDAAAGQVVNVIAARHELGAGTSATVKLQKNGVDLTGFTGVSVTTSPGHTDPANQAVVTGDRIDLVVTAVSGVPQNLSFTVVLEHTRT